MAEAGTARNVAVSVVLPYRDRVPWMLEAVESVKAQTLGDLEIVLVDDGSSEEAPAWLWRDPQIRHVRLEGVGRARARNAGVAAARAPLFAFLDSDDLFVPEKLERQVAAMEAQPDVVLCHTSYERIDTHGAVIELRRAGRFSGRVFPRITTNCPIAISTVVVRKEALPPDPFPAGIEVGEDLLLWVQLARTWKFLGIDERLAQVRIHGENSILAPNSAVIARSQLLPYLEPSVQRRVRAANLVDVCVDSWQKGAPRPAIVRTLLRSLLMQPTRGAIRALLRVVTMRPGSEASGSLNAEGERS